MLEKPSKLRSSALAGVAIGVISAVPGLNLINCCCCAGVMIGGLLAVYFYKGEFIEGMPPLESSDALILGIMAGIVGAFTSTIVSLLIHFLFGPLETRFARSLLEKIIEMLEENKSLPPEALDRMKEEFESSFESSRGARGVLGGLIITLIIYPIFAMIGGLLGYALFKPKPTILADQQKTP